MKLRYWYSDDGATNCSQCIISADNEDELARQIEQRRREIETGTRDRKLQQALVESLRRAIV
jgi:hypothetical protein